MKIREFIRQDVDIDVMNNVTDGCEIAFVGPMDLTKTGEEEWADVLDLEVETMTWNAESPFSWAVVDVTNGKDPETIEATDDEVKMAYKAFAFFKACAGFCTESEWNRWFVDDGEVPYSEENCTTEKHVCCICGEEFEGWGNNPYPLVKDEDARCCDECNNLVILARLAELGN